MPADIHILRNHGLGLTRAREVVGRWAEQARQAFGMECRWGQGERSNTLEFARQGVYGQVVVSAAHFELGAQLGLLLKAFRSTIEREIRKKLEECLVEGSLSRVPKHDEPEDFDAPLPDDVLDSFEGRPR